MDLRTARSIFARHSADFVVAYVFGSVATGSADEHSDIDVILVRDTALPFFDHLHPGGAGGDARRGGPLLRQAGGLHGTAD